MPARDAVTLSQANACDPERRERLTKHGNRELAVLPNGSSFMPTQRNWTGVVPAGTEVFTASETKGLMNRAGVRHFANGTGIFAGIGDALALLVAG